MSLGVNDAPMVLVETIWEAWTSNPHSGVMRDPSLSLMGCCQRRPSREPGLLSLPSGHKAAFPCGISGGHRGSSNELFSASYPGCYQWRTSWDLELPLLHSSNEVSLSAPIKCQWRAIGEPGILSPPDSKNVAFLTSPVHVASEEAS